jgi:hypothetical protein
MAGTIKFAIGFGVLGVCVALILGSLSSSKDISPIVLLALWPTSIFGLGFNGPTLSVTGILLAVIELGGNFILYGVVGLFLAGMTEQLWGKR